MIHEVAKPIWIKSVAEGSDVIIDLLEMLLVQWLNQCSAACHNKNKSNNSKSRLTVTSKTKSAKSNTKSEWSHE